MRLSSLPLSLIAPLAACWTNTWGDPSALDFLSYLDPSPAEYAAANHTDFQVAPDITTIHNGTSYIVKLPCIDCPFRHREHGMGYGEWEISPRENALLLNFTINGGTRQLELNSRAIYPDRNGVELRNIQAYQPPIWLYTTTLQRMIDVSMFDREFKGVGTGYASFDLNWDLTVVRGPDDPMSATLHFDIVSIDYDGVHKLSSLQQQIVRIDLNMKRVAPETMEITSIRLIDRFDAARAEAIATTRLHPTPSLERYRFHNAEWNRYGKLGTWEHFWNYLPWWLDRTIAAYFPLWATVLVVSPFWFCYRWSRRRRARAVLAAERTWKSIY